MHAVFPRLMYNMEKNIIHDILAGYSVSVEASPGLGRHNVMMEIVGALRAEGKKVWLLGDRHQVRYNREAGTDVVVCDEIS
jgi:hypothetical protein